MKRLLFFLFSILLCVGILAQTYVYKYNAITGQFDLVNIAAGGLTLGGANNDVIYRVNATTLGGFGDWDGSLLTVPKISSDTFYMPEGGMFYTDDDHGSGMYGTDDTIFFMTDDALKVYICNSEVNIGRDLNPYSTENLNLGNSTHRWNDAHIIKWYLNDSTWITHDGVRTYHVCNNDTVFTVAADSLSLEGGEITFNTARNTSIYESGNILYFKLNGTIEMRIASTGMDMYGDTGPGLRDETSTLTNPTIIPYAGNVDMGVGGNANDTLALIVGGTTGLTVELKSGKLTTRAQDTLVIEGDEILCFGGDCWSADSLIGENRASEMVGDTMDAFRDGGGSLEDLALLLTDPQPLGVLGCGVGLVGDTILIDASFNGYGFVHAVEDSIELTHIITNIPAGDTVNYSVVYNDTLWASGDCDTVKSIEAGPYETTTTALDGLTVPEDIYIWIEMDAVVVTKKPIKFRSAIYGYIKRD